MNPPFVSLAEEQLIESGGRRSLDSPFWKAMAFVCVALFSMTLALGAYIGRTSLDKLDRMNDSQIRLGAKMDAIVEYNTRTEAWKTTIDQRIRQIEMDDAGRADRLSQQRKPY